MSDGFFVRLENRVQSSNTLLCIGLDPHSSELATNTPQAAYDFCINIIESTHQYAAAFKPNSAFFERFGSEGFDVLQRVIQSIPVDIPVLLDCKRGDIDTTAQAYASSAYDALGAHAVTLSPFMGWDSVSPFVTGRYADKGAFVLCKTSNPSSNDLQMDNLADGRKLFEKVVTLCNDWNGRSTNSIIVGVVAGATDIDSLQRVRELSPNIWILCPGVGAQGGEAETVCGAGLRMDGSGLLVSVSRGISRAADKELAARTLRDSINKLRQLHITHQQQGHDNPVIAAEGGSIIDVVSNHGPSLQPYQQQFIEFAISQQVLQFGQFKLKSGRISPYFFNAGLFNSGRSLHTLSSCYARAIKQSAMSFDVIFGPAYKGIPLVTCVSVAWHQLFGEDKDICYNRKEAKDHGEGGLLVGASIKGRRVLIVDDVITAGTAIREAVDLLRSSGAVIVAAVVCLDRQEKTSDTASTSAIQDVQDEYGFPVLSIIQLKHLVGYASTASSPLAAKLSDIEAYRAQYGVDY